MRAFCHSLKLGRFQLSEEMCLNVRSLIIQSTIFGAEHRMFTRENDHVVEAVEETLAWWLLDAYHWPLDLTLEAVSEYQLLSVVLLVSSPHK